MAKQFLKRIFQRVSSLVSGLVSVLMQMLTEAPPHFQTAMHGSLAPAIQKVTNDDKTLLQDILNLVRNSRRFLAAAPFKLPRDTEFSHVIRYAFIISNSLLANSYSLENVLGAASLVEDFYSELIHKLGSRMPLFREALEGSMRQFSSALDDAKANPGDAQLCVKLGLAAANLAIDTAMGECEFTAVDNLMQYQRLIVSLAGDQPCQPAPRFLLFMRCTQICLFQNASLIVVLMRDITSRLRYSVEKAPDVTKVLKVCSEMDDYLKDVKGDLPVDPIIPLSKYVDQAVRRMKQFIRKDVHFQGEFAEAKFRRVIAQFFALCHNLKRARSTARALRWTCDIQDLLAAIAEAERNLQAPADGFNAARLPLARALMDVDVLSVALTGVPATVAAAFEEAAFAIATAESAEAAAYAIALARAGLTG
jgi:hypothetical protein